MARSVRDSRGAGTPSRRVTDEPQGHRGHPSEREKQRAARLGVFIERAVRVLVSEGFTEQEAIGFLAGVAHEKAAVLGETWSDPQNAKLTIVGVLEGRAAKEWSIEAIVLALWEIVGLTK